jgi:hypothetical protein
LPEERIERAQDNGCDEAKTEIMTRGAGGHGKNGVRPYNTCRRDKPSRFHHWIFSCRSERPAGTGLRRKPVLRRLAMPRGLSESLHENETGGPESDESAKGFFAGRCFAVDRRYPVNTSTPFVICLLASSSAPFWARASLRRLGGGGSSQRAWHGFVR